MLSAAPPDLQFCKTPGDSHVHQSPGPGGLDLGTAAQYRTGHSDNQVNVRLKHFAPEAAAWSVFEKETFILVISPSLF